MSPARGPTLLKQEDFSKNNEENSMCQLCWCRRVSAAISWAVLWQQRWGKIKAKFCLSSENVWAKRRFQATNTKLLDSSCLLGFVLCSSSQHIHNTHLQLSTTAGMSIGKYEPNGKPVSEIFLSEKLHHWLQVLKRELSTTEDRLLQLRSSKLPLL